MLPEERQQRLTVLWRVFQREAHRLAGRPAILPSHLHNMLRLSRAEDGPIAERAREALAGRPWLRLVNSPCEAAEESPLIRVLEALHVIRIAWAPRGRLLATGSTDAVRLWDGESGRLAGSFEGAGSRLAWSPDATLLAAPDKEGAVVLLSVTGEPQAVLAGDGKRVNAVVWSPDGDTLATAGDDRTVRLWDRSGELQAVLEGHTASVQVLAWSPCGTLLASAGDDDMVRLWRRAGSAASVLSGHDQRVLTLAWSPRGDCLASAGWDDTVRLWEATGEPRAVLEGHTDNCWPLAWSPDGALLASGSGNHSVSLWDGTGKRQAVLEGHTDPVWALAWSPDGELLASASHDYSVRVWTAGGAAWTALHGHTEWVDDVAWSPDGNCLASASGDGTVRLWERPVEAAEVVPGHTKTVDRVAWSPDGELLASGGEDGCLGLWDPSSGRARCVNRGHDDTVQALSWSPDGELVASAGSSHFKGEVHPLRLWDRGGALRHDLEGHGSPITEIAWAPDGASIASASGDAEIRVWSRDGACRAVLKGRESVLVSLAWSPDGELIASGYADGVICLWSDSEQRAAYRAHEGRVVNLSWSTDGNLLVSASDDDRTLRLWRRTGEAIAAVPHVEGDFKSGTQRLHKLKLRLAWSPDGTTLASASSEPRVRLWSSAGESRAVLEEHTEQIWALAWSPDGKSLATGGADNSVRLWDVATGACQVVAHVLAPVIGLQFSEDGRALRAADNGAATGNRPVPYVFQLCGIEPGPAVAGPPRDAARPVRRAKKTRQAEEPEAPKPARRRSKKAREPEKPAAPRPTRRRAASPGRPSRARKRTTPAPSQPRPPSQSLLERVAASGLKVFPIGEDAVAVPFGGERVDEVTVQVRELEGDLGFFAVPLPEPGRFGREAALGSLLRVSFAANYVKALSSSSGKLVLAAELPAAVVTPEVAEGLIRGLVHLGDVGKGDMPDWEGWQERLLGCAWAQGQRIRVDVGAARRQVEGLLAGAGLPMEPEGEGVYRTSVELVGMVLHVLIHVRPAMISFILYLGGVQPTGDKKAYMGRLLELNRGANVAKVGIDSDGDLALLYEVPAALPDLVERLYRQFNKLLLGVMALHAG